MKSTNHTLRCLRALAVVFTGMCAVSTALAANESTVGTATDAVKFDVAPATLRKAAPVYPYDMLLAGRTGWAEASFVVDYLGRPLFANPKAASDPAFAHALVAMVEASEYAPAKKGKHTVMAPSNEQFRFAEDTLDDSAKRVLGELRKGGGTIAPVSMLDARPRALRQDSPVYPRALKDDGLTGQAEIEFVVDKDGRVLFPHIVSATHEDFGWAAATAVAQWRFQPPQRNGQAVDTLMRVPILFDAHKLASAD